MSKLNINDLLSSLQQGQSEHKLTHFVQTVVNDKNKKINALSKKQQEMMRRETNYEMAKEEMDKWVGIIKINRQKQSLNFQQKDVGNLNVNFFPAQPLNDFHKKIQSKLESMNIKNQKSILKHEESVLEKVDPEQAKRRLIQARKHRTAVFYEEQKRRRISKIKSKLYHKIKKRQKQREEIKKAEHMTPGEKNEYIEKLTKQRIKERITLRHGSKNKHIQNLLRFNKSEKDGIQASINELNDLRHKQLQRVDENYMIQSNSEEYDDENYREQAMKDLQHQIEAMENEEDADPIQQNEIDGKLKDLKFIQQAKQKRLQKQKQDAYRIFSKLAKGKQLKQKDLASDMESQDGQAKESGSDQSEDEEAQRKMFGKKVKQNLDEQNHHKSQGNSKNIQSDLKNYLLGGKVIEEGEKNKILTQGINLGNLQSKYQPERIAIDLTTLIADNKEIYEGQQNEAVIENVRQFEQQKLGEIEAELRREEGANKNKQMKGWGRWAGPGISQKRIDPQEQLRKKLKMVEEIKRKRKDNSLAHVTINESRNKNLSDYFVRELPHEFANAEQFDFMQSEPVGPEWNSINQFKDNIKPKVITKAGQVITPAKLPRSVQAKKKI